MRAYARFILICCYEDICATRIYHNIKKLKNQNFTILILEFVNMTDGERTFTIHNIKKLL